MTTRALARSRARRQARAFTLIELLVATGAGLLVAMGAMVLARNATQVFQSESRVASAQLSATLGLTRLTADLARAGFLSTPNSAADPHMCGSRAAFPLGLQQLAALWIVKGGSVAAHAADLTQSTLAATGFDPDSVVIGGSFDTTEVFPVRFAGPEGGAFAVHLQTNSGAFQRMMAASQTGSEGLANIFAPGRFLRLVGPLNQEVIGVIASTPTTTPTTAPFTDVDIQLTTSPGLVMGGTCGITGLGSDWQANVVSRVKYDLRSVATGTPFSNLVASVGVLSGDAKRTELVRVELDQDGNEVPGTLELVAEFAVDLKFGLRVLQGPTGTTNPTLTPLLALSSAGNDQVYTVAGDVSNSAVATPQLIRAVQVRLATRVRAPDRQADVVETGLSDGRRVRMFIDTGTATTQAYARIRTLYAEVALQNLAGETW